MSRVYKIITIFYRRKYNENEETLFKGTYNSFKECVEHAVKLGLSLKNANLSAPYDSCNYYDLCEIDLRGADLRGANFYGTNLKNANFDDADLDGANFNKTNLENVNFKNVIGMSKSFRYSNLKNANFENINISFASIDMEGANIEGLKTSYGNYKEFINKFD